MKKIILLALLILPIIVKAGEAVPSDTTIYVKGRKIVIKENDEKIKVKLYEQKSQGDTIENEQIFEGIYRDGKSTERRMNNSINIPIPKLSSGSSHSNYISDPHWAGFGFGFANFADGKMNINKFDGIDVISGSSKEFVLNFYEHAWNISRSGFAIVSGTGFRFNSYHFDGNKALVEVNGVTEMQTAPTGRTYTDSKLHTTYFTIPILLEYQKKLPHTGPLYLSAGIVGNARICSSSKVRYEDQSGTHKEKIGSDLNIRPVSFDLLFQGGVGCFGVFARYSTQSLFESGKGPDVHTASIGLLLHFDL